MKYVNPNHPAGILHPQDTGLTLGGPGQRSRGKSNLPALSTEAERDPVFDAVWRGEREMAVHSLLGMSTADIR